jgi:predicted transcriptional regulator of viral defense system
MWKDIDRASICSDGKNPAMPRSRFDELVALAEENDGLVTADQARSAGFTDSVLARLLQRERIERVARGVYRIPYFPTDRFSQYREAVLWAKANRGPGTVAISHATALAVYEISDANPSLIHLTVPKSARLRREKPKNVIVHRDDLTKNEITVQEGLPLTTISKTVTDLLASGDRIDLLRQAISDARREGYIGDAEASRLRRRIESHLKALRASSNMPQPTTA